MLPLMRYSSSLDLLETQIYRDRLSGDLVKKGTPFKLIDLFSGAGGLTLGFTEKLGHCFIPVWANDFNKYAVDTYNVNFSHHCVHGDIVTLLEHKIKIPKADIVIGGPPCQGFSLLNKNRSNDPRKHLWRPFLDIVEISGASIFVMENVPQLLESFEFRKVLVEATKLGFKVTYDKLCAADYGVPQLRWRAFVIGCKFADPTEVFPPKKTHYNPKLTSLYPDEYIKNPTRWQTVEDAIGDLPEPFGTEIRNEPTPLDLQFGRTPTPLSLKRYKAIPKEGMNRFDLQKKAPQLTPSCWIRKTSGGTDLFGRLWWKKPSVTIRTEFFKPEKGRYLHPSSHRPITHREAARFQSFPDDFKFLGSKIEIAKQIGNAVPPVLAARIADVVYALLISRKTRKAKNGQIQRRGQKKNHVLCANA